MKILVINPNTTESFTKAVQDAVENYKNPGTEVIAVNPKTGPGTIESIFEEMLSGVPTLEIFLANEKEYDGFIIACYGNEGLVQAVREITQKPVIGITEASYHMACMLGRKFSVVSTGNRWESLLWDSVRLHGLEGRCASMRSTSIATSELESSGDDVVREHLLKESRIALEEDGAEVILLGCAGMTGLDKELEVELGVPVIDGVVAALKFMEALIGYGVGTSKCKTYQPLEPIGLHNLPQIFDQAYRHE